MALLYNQRVLCYSNELYWVFFFSKNCLNRPAVEGFALRPRSLLRVERAQEIFSFRGKSSLFAKSWLRTFLQSVVDR